MTLTESSRKINAGVFESLFREYFYSLVSFSSHMVSDPEAAKDIVHNVFVNLWETRDNFHLETSMKSWLFTSVRNRSLNYLRDNRKFFRNDPNAEIKTENTVIVEPDPLEISEMEGRVRTALDKLTDACRKIFRMTRYDGLKYREVAEKLGISQKTVETQMTRAFRILREELKDIIPVIAIILLYLFYMR